MPTIPLSECQNRGLYRIKSRNLYLAVFDAETKGFIGIREKFDDRYLAEEYHWDTGAPHGTAHPSELLPEVLPPELEVYVWRPQEGDKPADSNPKLLAWLEEMEKKYPDEWLEEMKRKYPTSK